VTQLGVMRELHITEKQFYEEMSPAITRRMGFLMEMEAKREKQERDRAEAKARMRR
jgi:hypothetical protein